MNAADSGKTYLPAAGHDWLLPLYDPLVKLLGAGAARRTLLALDEVEGHLRTIRLVALRAAVRSPICSGK